MDEQAMINAVREALPGLRALYLFGSTAKGEAGPASDVDIAVMTRPPLAPLQRVNLAADLGVRLGCDVDVIDLATASTVLRSQVISTGRRLYCAAEDLADIEAFETFVYSDYARLNEERAGILQDIRARGSVYRR